MRLALVILALVGGLWSTPGLAFGVFDHPLCWGDGHNARRSREAVQAFKKQHPCPKSCRLYKRTEDGRFVLYKRCGGCQVDHICPLACCGADDPSNMQWLTAEDNHAKGADCSECNTSAGRAGKEK